MRWFWYAVLALGLAAAVAGCGAAANSTIEPANPSEERVEVPDESGILTEEEADAAIAEDHRADLELMVEASPVVDGRSELTVAAQVLSQFIAAGPRVLFEFSSGVSAELPLPAGCDNVVDGVECFLPDDLIAADPPVEMTFVVMVDAGVVEPAATASLSSVYNPASNDPDPSNNVVTVTLTP